MGSGILAGAVALASSGDISGMLPALGVGSVVAALLGAHATASIGEEDRVSHKYMAKEGQAIGV